MGAIGSTPGQGTPVLPSARRRPRRVRRVALAGGVRTFSAATGNHDPTVLSEQDVDEMVRRLAHALRNPLAGVKSGVQLIHRLTAPTGEVAGYFESVLKQVDRIDRFVGDMQRWAKVGAGDVSRVAVRPVVERAAAAHRPAAGRAGVALVVAGGGDVEVVIDPTKLLSALGELLSNAIRYSPPGSQVVLSWFARAGDGLHITVDDEGPGIAPEHASRICQPFFSTSAQGNGLGLAIVERVCRHAGGRLEWQTRPGEGCRFTLILPEA